MVSLSRAIPIVILCAILAVTLYVFSNRQDPCPSDPNLSPVTSNDLRKCLNKMWADAGGDPIVDKDDPRYEYWASLPSISAVATDMSVKVKTKS